MTLQIDNGNCLELMKKLPDKSVDLFICDLPYGETNCKWDSKIDLDEFWSEFKRLRKSKRTACIHFCSSKFGYTLIKSWEKGYKMDMVWKKRNKTGGLQSRNRPMRNHEMVYFFYEQAPKYNRDKYHKRIQVKKEHNIEKEGITMGKTNKMKNTMHKCFEPANPASVLEGDNKYTQEHLDNNRKGAGTNNIGCIYNKENNKEYLKKNKGFEPRQPTSVVEESEGQKKAKVWGYEKCTKSFDDNEKVNGGRRMGANFEPPNPASVVEEGIINEDYHKDKNGEHTGVFSDKAWKGQPHKWAASKVPFGAVYNPQLPASVVEEFIEPAEDEPKSMFESTKVFIGKRHHQTEKPQDILEFFIKYWSDEGETILDPTMGSGSTGVACKKLNRNFIGYELDEKIFEVAQKRLE